MGYAVLHLEKASGNDAGMSAHIERTIKPKNADESRTHLNKELINFPEGVDNRTQAVQHRIDNAGISRKIGKNQVRAIRIMLSGTHEDMKDIQEFGNLKHWCDDNIDWLKQTYGAENLVSAVLHMDEKTPHIHATIVPIVSGERRKAKVEEQSGKKKYKKKSKDAARLCADDVMSRTKLKEYQNSYAERMKVYGLERGIEGSEAKHIGTQQYYRDLSVKNEDLNENIEILLQQQEQAKLELSKTKAEIKTEKFKSTAADVGTSIMDGVGSLLGVSKTKRLQSEVEELKAENAELKDNLGNEIKQLKVQLRTTEAEQKSAIGKLSEQLEKVFDYFPHIKNLLNWENFLTKMGLPKDMIRRLFNREEVTGSGELYSSEHSQKFRAENVTFKLEHDKEKPSSIRLTVDGTNIHEWFKQKKQEFHRSIGINIQPRQDRGMKR